jgi:hypothetical protein
MLLMHPKHGLLEIIKKYWIIVCMTAFSQPRFSLMPHNSHLNVLGIMANVVRNIRLKLIGEDINRFNTKSVYA